MIRLYDYGVPFDGADEDRACVAVAFAWSWQDFPVETDGESRPGNIIFSPSDIEHAKAFAESFVPALNAELDKHGFRELTRYGTGKYFWDLDDPEDLPGVMDMIQICKKNGAINSLAEGRDMGKVKLAEHVKRITGSRYFEFSTVGKLVSFRDENGRLCSP